MAFSFLESLFQSHADRDAVNLLKRIKDHSESCDSYTFDALVTALAQSSNKQIKRELSQTLHRLVQIELKKPNRHSCWFRGFLDHTLQEYKTCRKNIPDECLSSFLVLASQESSGYIRERAVTEWKTHKNPIAVRFLIDRLSDWVPNVRKAAWNSLRQYMTPEFLPYFLRRFYWIDRLLDKGNCDTVRFGEELIVFVLSHDFSERIGQYLQTAGIQNWLAYVKHSIDGSLKTNPLLLDVVRNDPSPTARSAVIRILDDLPEQMRLDFLDEALKDRAQPFRSRALYYIVKHLDHSGYERLTYIAASDYSPSIREAARYYLKDRDVNWHQYYHFRVDIPPADFIQSKGYDKRQMLGNLGGFGEFAVEDDIPFLERLLQIRDGKIQSLTLEAIYRLNPNRGIQLAKELLLNHAGLLGRTCVRILGNHSSPETLTFARKLFESESNRFRILALRLLNKIGGWKIAPDLILGTVDDDENVRRVAIDLLDQWIRKFATQCWIKPEEDDIRRVATAVELARQKKTTASSHTLKKVLFFFGLREK